MLTATFHRAICPSTTFSGALLCIASIGACADEALEMNTDILKVSGMADDVEVTLNGVAVKDPIVPVTEGLGKLLKSNKRYIIIATSSGRLSDIATDGTKVLLKTIEKEHVLVVAKAKEVAEDTVVIVTVVYRGVSTIWCNGKLVKNAEGLSTMLRTIVSDKTKLIWIQEGSAGGEGSFSLPIQKEISKILAEYRDEVTAYPVVGVQRLKPFQE